jgi:hypothetical protein
MMPDTPPGYEKDVITGAARSRWCRRTSRRSITSSPTSSVSSTMFRQRDSTLSTQSTRSGSQRRRCNHRNTHRKPAPIYPTDVRIDDTRFLVRRFVKLFLFFFFCFFVSARVGARGPSCVRLQHVGVARLLRRRQSDRDTLPEFTRVPLMVKVLVFVSFLLFVVANRRRRCFLCLLHSFAFFI